MKSPKINPPELESSITNNKYKRSSSVKKHIRGSMGAKSSNDKKMTAANNNNSYVISSRSSNIRQSNSTINRKNRSINSSALSKKLEDA